MKKILSVLLAVLLTIGLAGCFGLVNNGSKKPKYEIVEKVSMSVEYNSYLGYSVEIKGKLKNISSKEFTYVSVTFAIYDKDGNQLDTALDNMNYLQAGSVWQFSAITIGGVDVEPKSCKLVDVTTW